MKLKPIPHQKNPKPVLQLKAKIKNNKKIDCLLTTNSLNIRYLANKKSFSRNDLIALITPKTSCLLLSLLLYHHKQRKPSNLNRAKYGFDQVYPLSHQQNNFMLLRKILQNLLPEKSKINLGFEKNDLRYSEYINLKKRLKIKNCKLKINLVSTQNIIENLREIKNKTELKKLKKAGQITKNAFLKVKKIIRPNITELKIAWEIEKFMKENGADSLAFPTIIASGPNSALPHHQTGNRQLKKNDIVLIDAGCKHQGYCSDMTRVFFRWPTEVSLAKFKKHCQKRPRKSTTDPQKQKGKSFSS